MLIRIIISMERVDKLRKEHTISYEDFTGLMKEDNPKIVYYLYKSAQEVAAEIFHKKIYIRGLIEFSNHCKNNCYYCGLRRDNASADRYRMTPGDIITCVDEGYKLGFRTFVLQSGEDVFFTDDRMCQVISGVHKLHPDCAITLSVGERSFDSYKRFKEAGASRYLLRHETADKCHYDKLHPKDMSYENRMQCLKDLKSLGYQVGCGFMVGSPEQTRDNLYQDISYIIESKPQMVGIGPFIPHSATPFALKQSGTLETTLRLLAIIRLIDPNILLPAKTSLATLTKAGRKRGILAGANVVMPNLTPRLYREKYALYDKKLASGAEAAEGLELLKNELEDIGYDIIVGRGDYPGFEG